VFDTIEKCIDQGIEFVVIDSIAGLCPREELEGEFGEHHMGLQARWISQALRKLSAKIRQTKTVAIFINQIRLKIGVIFGNPETTPGGKALKFYSSVRLDVRQRGQLKEGTGVVGIQMGIYVPKNKVAMPFKRCDVDFFFDRGFDTVAEYFDFATGNIPDLFIKKGSGHFLWGEVAEKSKTKNEWVAFLKENPNVLKILIAKVVGV
jgi:recombination protein RecA